MSKRPRIVFISALVFSMIAFVNPPSFAAKTGSSCKKLNAKSWDGENPIVCKKKKGKLIWTKFSSNESAASGSSVAPSPTPSPSKSVASLVLPKVERVVSGSNWAAFEVSNVSSADVLTHPSYLVTASTSNGEVIFNSRYDKFPMLLPRAKAWIFFPYSNLLFKSAPQTVALTLIDNSSNRPRDPAEWPAAENAQFVDEPKVFGLTFPGIGVQFNLVNNSKSLKLSEDSLYYFFCLDATGTPIFAGYSTTDVTLLAKGTSQIVGPTKLTLANLSLSSCKSISVTLGPIFIP